MESSFTEGAIIDTYKKLRAKNRKKCKGCIYLELDERSGIEICVCDFPCFRYEQYTNEGERRKAGSF